MSENSPDTELFAELYDVQPQAIIWLRPIWSNDVIVDFEFAYCNDEALSYLNLRREQLKGLCLSNSPTMTDPLRRRFLSEMIQVFTTGRQSETAFYNPALNKYARVLRTRLRDGVLSVVQDRSEENRIIQKLEEQTSQLQAQKTLLDNILHYSSNGISVSQAVRNDQGTVTDLKTILANDAAVRFVGLPKEMYVGKTANEYDPDFTQSSEFRQCVETLAHGTSFFNQYFLAATNRWLEVTTSRMDKDCLIHIFTDITAAKHAQLQLAQAAERLHAVFNAASSGMFTFVPVENSEGEIIDFRFVISNPAFATYAGQTPDVLEGALGSTYFPGYLHNGVFDMYKKTYLTGETLRKDVHYNVDGLDLHLDLQSTKVHNEVLVTFTDYTVIKKTQLQLERMVEDLRRSNALLEEFAHAASHDLKEPIRKISVFAGRLRESLGDRVDEAGQRLFERMQVATNRMALLVDDLLTYSHLSEVPYEKEEVDLNTKLSIVLSDLELDIEEKQAKINVGPLPVVRGYRRQLQQLFQNLLANAMKYSKDGVPPAINIRAKKVKAAAFRHLLNVDDEEKQYHLIEVEDNGIGFESEQSEKIFQMFHRLHGRGQYEGTGIGLAITRRVVENHGGKVWATSTPGVGSTFFVLLPA